MQYTYTTLLASCQNYQIDDSSEYETEFPKIVQLAEMRIIKDLNLGVFDTQTGTVTLTSGSQTVVKPSDFIAIQDFFILVSGSRVYLQLRSKSYMDDYWRNPLSAAQPIYYCENTTASWLVAPTPDQNYSYQVNYIARPLPMTSGNPTTWIGDKLGECLLYATLLGSMPFFREDVAVEQGITQYWSQAYQTSIGQAMRELYPSMSAKDDVVMPMSKKGV